MVYVFKPVKKEGFVFEVTDQFIDDGRSMKEIKMYKGDKVMNRVLSSDIRDQSEFENLADFLARQAKNYGL